MNKSGGRSPSRRKKSPGRKVESPPQVRRSLRDRSRSRGRIYEEDVLNDVLGKEVAPRPKSRTRKSPARKTPTRPKPKPKITEDVSPLLEKKISPALEFDLRRSMSRQSGSVEKERLREHDSVIRSSMSRFDDIVQEAVVTVRRTTRSHTNNKVVHNEVEKEVKTMLSVNNVVLKDKPHREFGGCLGAAALTLLIPLVVLLLQVACTKESCTLKGFKLPLSWRKYFDEESALWYSGFMLLQVLLSFLPIGTKVTLLSHNFTPLTYRCNGLVNVVVTLAGVYVVKTATGYSAADVLDKTAQMCVVAILGAVLVSAGLYLKGRSTAQVNPFGNSGNPLYDFWAGREVNPRLGPLDLKCVVIRAALVLTVVYNAVLVYKVMEEGDASVATPTGCPLPLSLMLVSFLQSVYCLDFLLSESSLLTSFTVQHEGLGYNLVMSSALFPFFVTILPKFIYINSVENSVYALVATFVLYCAGHTLLRMSNSQKSQLRSNPIAPRLSGLETMSTADGKHLLVGGLWGRVRHPNHAGSLLAQLAWALPGAVALPWHPLPYAVGALTATAFLHRCLRDADHCAFRYGPAYHRYAAAVPHHLLPKIF